MERLDKVLSNLGYGTRKELKKICRSGLVEVNGEIAKDSGMQVDPEKDKIIINGEEIFYRKFIYLMMNKPEGVVSATYDNRDETVVDLLEIDHQVFEPFPVGRLDKDTVGLLLLTDEDVAKFKAGITLDDGYLCKEAKLEILNATDEGSEVMVTIQEGKFHQVKRMFEAVGKSVVYLKRTEFGTLPLDEDLEEGEYRELTEEELAILKSF